MKIKRRVSLGFLAFASVFCVAGAIFGMSIWNQNQLGDANAASTADLKGKAVLFDGDSIAMGSYALGSTSAPRWSYANYIEETYEISNTNVSIGGARFYWPNAASDSSCSSGDAQKCVIPNHLTSAVKNTSYDYIILEGAINDLHSNYYNGDHESYAMALRSYFNTVTTNSKWAHAKIGFVIVPKPDYSRKKLYRQEEEKVFWKTIQDICDEYSIEFINFFKQSSSDDYAVPSGFDWDFMDTKASEANDVGSFDGLHPSKGGHKVLGEYIAKWMVNLPNYKYTVSFNSNGSSLNGATSQSVVHGKKATTPTYNIDSDQHFDYWSTTKSGAAYNFNSAVNGDLTLYAVWNVNVKFDGNGGKINGESAKTVSVAGNSRVSDPGNPVRDGYNFTYWSESNSCGAAFDFNTAIARDKILYACWSEVPTSTYTLGFDLGRSSDEVATQKCTTTGDSCSVTVPSTVPTYTTWYFLGYSDIPNATKATYHPGDQITLSSNKTIYAVWADGSIERQDNSGDSNGNNDDNDNNNEYVAGSNKDIIIKINYPLANFTKLMIDNKEIDNTNNDKYKVEEGSTIITVYSNHLDTLEPGDHVLQAVYDNNTTKELSFTVKAAEDNNNSDNNNNTDNNDNNNEDEEDLPVPNTSKTTPDTGTNTKQDENNTNILTYTLPITLIVLAGGLLIRNRNKAHRKFEW